ncbi:helix-turn-helix domain-containing protein [Burkholderia gladioli]|uniref:transcriptional regulator n=1 Tax=Burkholderia gladioli TaxID=28095 RepID=UPI00285F334D|nr:YdaS family helix-turn-helix protein [Burkholderia gladioli]MDR8087816.1 helix-turn-helix domain-containing protein [Burkholderia gladioli]
MNLSTYLSSRKVTQSAFAVRLGVSQGLIYQWLTGRRPVSADKCVAIERATDGEVTRRDLRPNDWRDIWPELAEAKEGA